MEIKNRFHKCRLCLKIGDFCSIFEKDDSIKLSEMVMSFTNVQIHEGDGYSDRVCTSCIENLSTAYLFKLQCERIDNLLRKYPDIQIDKPDDKQDYNDLYNQEFHMHTQYIKEDGDDNSVKAGNHVQRARAPLSPCFEASDETDSDVDSVKCVYCNESYSNYGAHTCHVTCTIEHNQLQRSSSNETLVATDVAATKASKPISPIPPYVNVSCVLCDQTYDQYDNYVTHLNKCTINVKLHHFVCPVCHEMFTDKLSYLEHLKLIHFSSNDETVWRTCQNDTLESGNNDTVWRTCRDDSLRAGNDETAWRTCQDETLRTGNDETVWRTCLDDSLKAAHDESMRSHNETFSDAGTDCVDFAPIIVKTRKPKAVRRQIGWSVEDIYQEIECQKIEQKPNATSSPLKNFFSKLGNE